MADVKLTIDELQVKNRIENHYIYIQDLILLNEKMQILKEMDSGSSSQYGQERASGGERVNKVELLTMKRMELEVKISNLERSLGNIIEARDQLKGTRLKIINYLFEGYKMSDIARELRLKRHQVKYIRKRALKEMSEWLKKVEG